MSDDVEMSEEDFVDDGDMDMDEDENDGGEDDGGYEEEVDHDGDVDSSDGLLALLKHDIAEIEHAGYIGGFSAHTLELDVWVGIPNITELFTDELLKSCGFHLDRKLVCKLVFSNPASYMSHCPTVEEKKIMIRQTSDTDLYKSKLTDNQEFGLWWTLQTRLSDWLKSNWPTFAAEAHKAMSKVDSELNDIIEQVISVTDVNDKKLIRFALKESRNDSIAAIELLMDRKKTKALQSKLTQQIKDGTYIDSTCRPGNLLKAVIDQIIERIRISCRYCIVCDKKHHFELLKPTVCSDVLCNFQLVDLGLGLNVESDIIHNPEALDLLICLTIAGASSNRFTPFPTSVRVQAPDKVHEFTSAKQKEIIDCLQLLPPLSELQTLVKEGKLKKRLDKLHPLLYKLLRWIVGTNAAHLEKLKPGEEVQGIKCHTQFMMKTAPPDKEKSFQEAKAETGGSFYVFHGSATENWHCILRIGLKNYSNTSLMTTGAAFGPGIYMSGDSATSLSYSPSRGSTWENSIFKGAVSVLALCEVVDYGKGATTCMGRIHRPQCSHVKGSPHYRCEDETLVCTRFLLVFGAGDSRQSVASKNLVVPAFKRSFENQHELKNSKDGKEKEKEKDAVEEKTLKKSGKKK